MPRPSRSNLTSPIAAQSSLSHCRTERFSIRPHSTGQTCGHRPVADHHSAGMDAQVPREVLDLSGQVEDVGGNGVFDAAAAVSGVLDLGGQRRPAVELLGVGVLLTG